MKKQFLLALSLCVTFAVSASTVTYTADDNTIFSNPERGFITMLEGHLSESKPYAVKGKESTLDSYKINKEQQYVSCAKWHKQKPDH